MEDDSEVRAAEAEMDEVDAALGQSQRKYDVRRKHAGGGSRLNKMLSSYKMKLDFRCNCAQSLFYCTLTLGGGEFPAHPFPSSHIHIHIYVGLYIQIYIAPKIVRTNLRRWHRMFVCLPFLHSAPSLEVNPLPFPPSPETVSYTHLTLPTKRIV